MTDRVTARELFKRARRASWTAQSQTAPPPGSSLCYMHAATLLSLPSSHLHAAFHALLSHTPAKATNGIRSTWWGRSQPDHSPARQAWNFRCVWEEGGSPISIPASVTPLYIWTEIFLPHEASPINMTPTLPTKRSSKPGSLDSTPMQNKTMLTVIQPRHFNYR